MIKLYVFSLLAGLTIWMGCADDANKPKSLTTGEMILSVIIPIVGLWIFFTSMSKDPIRSKTALQCAVCGILIAGFLYIGLR